VTPVSFVSTGDTYTGLRRCLCRPATGSRGVTRLMCSSSGTNDVFAPSGLRYLLTYRAASRAWKRSGAPPSNDLGRWQSHMTHADAGGRREKSRALLGRPPSDSREQGGDGRRRAAALRRHSPAPRPARGGRFRRVRSRATFSSSPSPRVTVAFQPAAATQGTRHPRRPEHLFSPFAHFSRSQGSTSFPGAVSVTRQVLPSRPRD
jgi:hypothetical protein